MLPISKSKGKLLLPILLTLTLTHYLLVSSADKMSGLIWNHTVSPEMVFMKENLQNINFEKSADDKKTLQNYPAGNELGFFCIREHSSNWIS